MGKFKIDRKEFFVGLAGKVRKIYIVERNGRKFGNWNWTSGTQLGLGTNLLPGFGKSWRSLAEEISVLLPGSGRADQKSGSVTQPAKAWLKKGKEGFQVSAVE